MNFKKFGKTEIIITILFSIFTVVHIFSSEKTNDNSIETVKEVADKIIEESNFAFDVVPQKEVVGIQVLDFKNIFPESSGKISYALSSIVSKNDAYINLGLSYKNGIKIWINDNEVYTNAKNKNISFKEIAYNMFTYDDTILVKLQKGKNKILIKSFNNKNIFLGEIKKDEEESQINFKNYFLSKEDSFSPWIFVGSFNQNNPNLEEFFPPEKSIEDYYNYENKIYSWQLPKQNLLLELKIDSTNVFTKDSYLDWHYANGLTMMSLLSLYRQTNDKKYYNFVKHYCDFIVKNYAYFKDQYENKFAFRGSYHRIFRRTMLDDAGAPTLPFLELYLNHHNKNYETIIDSMNEFVSNQQVRLSDGTFCRPEPIEMTVWADDLFMSVPFLLKMAKIKNDKKYYDDAAKQIINFHKLLYDKDKNLFKHGWFSETKKTSNVYWGRANGWIIWAISEALISLPKNHQAYNDILKIYQDFVKGLIKYQDNDGMWYQVLDQPESYEETSCTAMFVLGIARGISNNWISEKYKTAALKGWDALKNNINNGVVKNICVGTGIGNDLDFYFNRPTRKNDPRGLGAVITAGLEISKLSKR